MDENALCLADCMQAIRNRLLASLAADHRLPACQAFQRGSGRWLPAFRNDDDQRMGASFKQRFDRMAKDGFSAPTRKLLGKRLPSTQPFGLPVVPEV